MCLGIVMVKLNKQHRSNIWSSIDEKGLAALRLSWKKVLLIKKSLKSLSCILFYGKTRKNKERWNWSKN